MADQDQDKKRREAEDRAHLDAMQGWIHSTFRDPEFRKLSGVQKIQVMEEADPEFKAIPTMADKARVVQSYMYQFPQALPSTGSKALDFAQGFAGAALTPLYVGGDIIRRATGQERIINRPEVQYMMNPPESTAGKLGAIAEPVAELFAMPEMAPTKIPKLLKSGQAMMRAGKPVITETLGSLARRSAFEGAKMGTQAELHGDKPIPGAIFGASAPWVGWAVKSIAPAVRSGAQGLLQRALYPTTKTTKGEAQEVVPELLTRKFWATTWNRLYDQADTNLKAAETRLTQEENKAIKNFNQTYTTTGYYNVRPPRAPRRPGPTVNVPPTGAPAAGAAPGAAVSRAAGGGVGAARPPAPGELVAGEGGGMLSPEAARAQQRANAAQAYVRGAGAPPPPPGGAAAGAAGAGGAAGGAAGAGGAYRVYTTAQGMMDVKPVLDKLRTEMGKTHVSGYFPTPQSQTLYRQLFDQYRRLARISRVGTSPNGIYGRFVTLREAIDIRRILDKPLGQSGAFYNDPKWESLANVQKTAANELRGLINGNFPQLADANHEYHLWKTTVHIMDASDRRFVGQQKLMHILATAGSMTEGIARGGDFLHILRDTAIANVGAALASSPGVHSMGSAAFNQIADAMETRNLERLLQAAGTVMRPKQDQGDNFDIAPLIGPGSVSPPAIGPRAGGGPKTALAAAPPAGTQVTGSVVSPGQIPESEQQYRYTTREGIPVYGRTQPSPAQPESGAAPAGLTPQASRLIADAVTRIPGAQPELPRIMRVVAAQESAGQQTKDGETLKSPKGAMGIMQLTQATADTYAVDPNDPADNIKGGGYFLRDLIKKYGSDERGLANVFAAYYNGHVPTDWGKAPDTAQYVRQMMARMGYSWSPPAGRR